MKKFFFLLLLTTPIFSFSQGEFNSKIDAILAAQIDTKLSPGLTVGIVKDGKLIYHNSEGMMNLEYDVPFNDSTVFGIASVTKQFTSACIAILEKQGKLSIKDDVRKYIPELTFSSDTIRIKHLLNHTSGIRNHNVLLDLSGFDYEHQGYTNKMIQDLMFRQKGVNNVPGEKMLYSNTNYVLLALLVERISGMEIHDFAKKELFDPLGMSNTFYVNDLSKVVKNRAYCYYKAGENYKQPKSLTLCVGAGGVASTIADLAKWSQVFLNKKHDFAFISDFVTELIPLNNGKEMQHARGMFVTPYQGHLTYNHSGRDLGMRSQFISIPDLNLGVIVFSNSEHINAVDLSYEILDLWIDKYAEKSLPTKKHKHKKKEMEAFAGQYQELNSDLRMHVFIENDTMNALSSFGRNPVKLTSVSEGTFSRINNASVKYTFLNEGNSDADLLVDFGGAIFYLERIELSTSPNLNSTEFVGSYFSKELDITYELTLLHNKLTLNFLNNEGILLTEGETDVFGANRRTKYNFIRDKNNQVVSFYVSAEGTVKDILFEKIK